MKLILQVYFPPLGVLPLIFIIIAHMRLQYFSQMFLNLAFCNFFFVVLAQIHQSSSKAEDFICLKILNTTENYTLRLHFESRQPLYFLSSGRIETTEEYYLGRHAPSKNSPTKIENLQLWVRVKNCRPDPFPIHYIQYVHHQKSYMLNIYDYKGHRLWESFDLNLQGPPKPGLYTIQGSLLHSKLNIELVAAANRGKKEKYDFKNNVFPPVEYDNLPHEPLELKDVWRNICVRPSLQFWGRFIYENKHNVKYFNPSQIRFVRLELEVYQSDEPYPYESLVKWIPAIDCEYIEKNISKYVRPIRIAHDKNLEIRFYLNFVDYEDMYSETVYFYDHNQFQVYQADYENQIFSVSGFKFEWFNESFINSVILIFSLVGQ
ncbi:hypothetical protein HZS_5101 [Henneguya salminicola]|nr:hypothetical protein HZS_5101 [Henneguya salminicola]